MCLLQFLVQSDECTSIRRMCFKGIWPTAPRDFVVSTTWFEDPEDNSLYIVSRSASDDYCPQQKGYVRGHINISGYWIQPIARDGKDSYRMTLVAHTELGGTLPSSVVNMLSTSAPLKMLATIGDILKR